MKTTRQILVAALLAACCATAFAAGQASPPHEGAGAGVAADHGPRGGPDEHGPGMDGAPSQGRGPGFGGPGFGHARGGGFGRLAHSLQLSEAQRDRLFAIEHAAAPQRRQQMKAVRHAHDALRALRDAAQFDEARAGAAARELGQAVAAEALLEARVHAQALAVLTPEQREQLRAHRRQPPRERP